MQIDDLVGKYIKVREKKSLLKAAYDLDVARYEKLQETIESLLLLRFEEMGVDSVKTSAGTAYTTTRTSASMADWGTFRQFCEMQEDPFMFLDRKANKAACEEYKASNDDLPPGINWTETRVVNFRRA